MVIHKLKEFFRSITHRYARTQSIKRSEDGFTVRDGGRELLLRLSEIVAVNGVKIDKVTYEEDYLVLITSAGEKVPVGELADGFTEFERAIYVALSGFPREWRMTVESAPASGTVVLWRAKQPP
jgi:hypothetical protein